MRLAFFAAVVMTAVVFIMGASLAPSGTRDAWSIWNLSARNMFQGGEFWTNTFSVYQYGPDYPLLLPANVARLWHYAGAASPLSPISIGFVFSFASLGLLVAGLKYLRSPALGLLGGLLMLSANAFQAQAPSQVADIPVAYYYLAAIVLFVLYDHLPEARPGWVALAGVAAGLAVWTKNDAWLFLIGITATRLVIYMLKQDRRGYFREAVAYLAGLAPVLAFVLLFKFTLAHPNVLITEQGQATLPRLADSSRYGIILQAIFQQAYQLDIRRSTPFLFLLGLALLLGLDIHHIRRRTRFTFIGLLGCLLVGYFFVYVVTPVDLAWHLQTSLFRIALQVWPLAVFFITLLLRFGDPLEPSEPVVELIVN